MQNTWPVAKRLSPDGVARRLRPDTTQPTRSSRTVAVRTLCATRVKMSWALAQACMAAVEGGA